MTHHRCLVPVTYTSELNCQSISQSTSHTTSQSISQSTIQSLSQSPSQSVSSMLTFHLLAFLAFLAFISFPLTAVQFQAERTRSNRRTNRQDSLFHDALCLILLLTQPNHHHSQSFKPTSSRTLRPLLEDPPLLESRTCCTRNETLPSWGNPLPDDSHSQSYLTCLLFKLQTCAPPMSSLP